MHIFSMSKITYIIKPYEVGSRTAKSLALIIPSKVRKQANIDSSTAFELGLNEKNNSITLQILKTATANKDKKNMIIPAGEGFPSVQPADTIQTSISGFIE
jgi:hypothetical protein